MKLISIFPYVIVRLSPFSATKLNLFHSFSIIEKIKHLNEFDESITFLRQEICSKLHSHISLTADDNERQFLLNLKRSVFNGRQFSSIFPFLIPQHIQVDINNLLLANADRLGVFENLSFLYPQKKIEEKRYLKEMARSEVLTKGLLLSSNNLLKRLETYSRTSPDLHKKKERQTEQGLLRYFTRTCLKTTPFSSFTSLSLGTIKDFSLKEDCFSKSIAGNLPPQRSHTRLNNFILKYLILHFANIPEIYEQFGLRINPTLRIKEGCYFFLLNVNNNESFQTIAVEPQIDYIIEFVNKCTSDIPIYELINQIIKEEKIDADFDELSAFLNRIVSYGLLEIDWKVSGSDPHWDNMLCKLFLDFSRKTVLCEKIHETLSNLRLFCELYVDADTTSRSEILNNAVVCLSDLCEQLKKVLILDNDTSNESSFRQQLPGPFPFKMENIFLEDTSIDGQIELNHSEVIEIANCATKMIAKMELFDNRQAFKETLYDFFCKKYLNINEVDFLQFYEDLSREGLLLNKNILANFGKETDSEKLKDKWQEIFIDELKKKQNTDSVIICITDELLSAVNHRLGYMPRDIDGRSYTMMIQPSRSREVRNNKLQVFLFSVATGYGKMTGRYYYMFDPIVHQKQFEYNTTHKSEGVVAELTDANYFNANLHFAGTEVEISSSGSQNNQPLEKQISAKELLILKSGSTLTLVDRKSRKNILPIDLGLQALSERSHLYQLLDKFSPATQIGYYPICFGVNYECGNIDKEGIIRCPRIVYEDQLIIQRRSWTIPFNKIPLRKQSESDLDFFIRVNAWRSHHLLPTYGFITLWIRNKIYTDHDVLKRLKHDDYKPQYMDFTSPIMLLLFEKMTLNISDSLYIEEMWPDYDHLIKFSEQSHACEMQIQWKV